MNGNTDRRLCSFANFTLSTNILAVINLNDDLNDATMAIGEPRINTETDDRSCKLLYCLFAYSNLTVQFLKQHQQTTVMIKLCLTFITS